MSSAAPVFGRPDTRERILQAAFELLPELGPRLRVADVAARAGVSRQAVYLHFGNRTGLLIALGDWADRTLGLGELMDRVRDAPTGRQALVRMLEAHAAHSPLVDPLFRVGEAHRDSDPALAAVFDDRMRWRLAAHRAVVVRIADDGDLAEGWDVDQATDLFFAVTLNSTWRELTVRRGWTPQQYVQHMSRLLTRALLRPPSDHTDP